MPIALLILHEDHGCQGTMNSDGFRCSNWMESCPRMVARPRRKHSARRHSRPSPRERVAQTPPAPNAADISRRPPLRFMAEPLTRLTCSFMSNAGGVRFLLERDRVRRAWRGSISRESMAGFHLLFASLLDPVPPSRPPTSCDRAVLDPESFTLRLCNTLHSYPTGPSVSLWKISTSNLPKDWH